MNLKDIIDGLRAQRGRLDQAIAALEGSPRGRRPARATTGSERRVMSAAARLRISRAMKARWAARKRGQSATKPAKARKKSAPRRRQMSPAAKKRLSALMIARWAARKRQQ